MQTEIWGQMGGGEEFCMVLMGPELIIQIGEKTQTLV